MNKINKFVLPIYFLMIGIWTLPWPLIMPHFGLDSSWVIGINKAVADNLQFGPDIAFTFGPLGFLYLPFHVDHTLWFLSLIFTLFVHFSFILCIALLTFRSAASWKEYIALLAIIIPIPFLKDYELLLSVVILLYLLITHEFDCKYQIYILSLVSILLAIASLLKVSMAMAAVSIIVAFLLICVLNSEVKLFFYIFIFYISSVIILWIMTGQFLTNLPAYIFNSYYLSSGYNDAMATDGPEWQVYAGLISIIFIVFLFVYSLIKGLNHLFLFVFLNIGVLFLAFKHGFVRHDEHVTRFFAAHTIFFVWVYLIYRKDTSSIPRTIAFLLSAVFVGSIYQGAPGIIGDNILQKLPAYEFTLSLISDQSYQTQLLDISKRNIRYNHPLDNKIIQYLNNKTVDIFPWDVALVWAYDLNWSPRPVFQSYSAYTQHLDKLNAQHFSTGMPVQAILYAYKSIDGRYPLFDEPSTFAKILHNYTFVNKSGEFLLLSYDPKKNTPIIEEYLGTVRVEPGQPIKIPKYDSGYVFGQIKLEYSTFGKFMKLSYKPSPAYIRFRFSDFTDSNEFRFIPGVAMNGIFLSQYVRNVDDLVSVFSGNITQDITEMAIYVDNPVHYKKYIEVRFVGVPASVAVKRAA